MWQCCPIRFDYNRILHNLLDSLNKFLVRYNFHHHKHVEKLQQLFLIRKLPTQMLQMLFSYSFCIDSCLKDYLSLTLYFISLLASQTNVSLDVYFLLTIKNTPKALMIVITPANIPNSGTKGTLTSAILMSP